MSKGPDNQLDKAKLDNMKIALLQAERENLNKRTFSEDQMVEKLRRIIIDEVRKPY